MAKVSVCTPIHKMQKGDYFLERLQNSLEEQTFRDFDVVITAEGKMAENTNAAIKQATGQIIKILYMDDFLWNPLALQRVSDAFDKGAKWYASGCVHTTDGISAYNPHMPSYNENIKGGANTIGSPSVIAFENNEPLLFDENLSWLLDCELYTRLHTRYGEPYLESSTDVAIGVGGHQTTQLLSEDDKLREHTYLTKKYAN